MNDPYFFGYGSLVNRQTHAYPKAVPAHVTGWRRMWRSTSLREMAFLTAERDSSGEITGLIAAVPGADWAALDVREAAYARHQVENIRHGLDQTPDIAIYSVEAKYIEDAAHPILLSYLDTVVQGYLTEFGEAEARRFFDTTDGWHHPILNDRDAPIYPRTTALTAQETKFVDENLKRMGSQTV